MVHPDAVGLVHSELDEQHAPPVNGLGRVTEHVEQPERTATVWRRLVQTGLAAQCVHVPSREVTRAEAETCHSCEHCDALEALEHAEPARSGGWLGSAAGGQGWLRGGGDMYLTQATPRAARLAAGGVLELTDRVCSGSLRSGFAVVRPPGHHACSDRMCGFCFLNSVAIAARAAVRRHRLKRVLILDWDVHHGNGTQQIFEADESVLYLSLHKLTPRFFPGTGEAAEAGVGGGVGYTVNLPWRHDGMGDAEYAAAFDALVMPVAAAYDPELVIVSAGFDAAKGDKVGGMALTSAGFASMASRLRALAGGRLVFALEGGYKPTVVARCVDACVRVLLSPERSAPAESVDLGPRVLAKGAAHAIGEAVRANAAHWPVLRDILSRVQLRSSRTPRSSRTSRPSVAEEEAPAGGEAATGAAAARGGTQGTASDAVATAAGGGTHAAADALPVSSAEPDDVAEISARLAATLAPPATDAGDGEVPMVAKAHPCADCGRLLPRSAFAPSQFKKRRNGAGRRCRECCAGGGGAASTAEASALT